jgi:hypothetical protein
VVLEAQLPFSQAQAVHPLLMPEVQAVRSRLPPVLAAQATPMVAQAEESPSMVAQEASATPGMEGPLDISLSLLTTVVLLPTLTAATEVV